MQRQTQPFPKPPTSSNSARNRTTSNTNASSMQQQLSPRTTRTTEIRKQQNTLKRMKLDEEDSYLKYNNESTFGVTTHNNSQQQQQENNSSLENSGISATSASALAAATNLHLQSFEAILSLMKNPSTAEQFDRHSSQLAALLPHLLAKPSIPARLVDPSSSLGGLPALITKVAEVVSNNEAATILSDSLVQLLELASFPIQCSTLHDQRSMPACVVALLESVSAALVEPHTLAIRTQAATVMRDIIRRVNEKCGADIRGGHSKLLPSSSSSSSSSAASASSSSSRQNITTGSAISDLRASVTKRSTLALANAWRESIEREFQSTINLVRQQSGHGGSENQESRSESQNQSQQQQQQNTTNATTTNASRTQSQNSSGATNANDVTIEGIDRQLQQRDASMEVVALLQALTAATSVRTRAKWLLSQDYSSHIDQLIFSTLRLSNGDARTPLCVEVIWNLLQLCPAEAAYFATRDNYETLQSTLRIAVSEGHVGARRTLRNDILVVFGLLTDAAPDSQCVSPSLVDIVLELACGVELGLVETPMSQTALQVQASTKIRKQQEERQELLKKRQKIQASIETNPHAQSTFFYFQRQQQLEQEYEDLMARQERERNELLEESTSGGGSVSLNNNNANTNETQQRSDSQLERVKAHQLMMKQHHTIRNEDMQMKIIGWDLLRRWCLADEELAELTFASRFFDALLCYIDVGCENKAVVAWSAPQLLELQEHCLRNVEELIRVGCPWFCAARGPSIAVSYVLECPARPTSLMKHAISLLAEAASSPARKLVAENGAIPLALRLLASLPLSRETIDRHVNCLSLLADVVDRTEEYQIEFSNNNGVEVIMPLLQGAVDFADLGDELMLAAVDCVWGCVLGLEQNETRFLELGGVGALLSILDVRKILEDASVTKAKTLATYYNHGGGHHGGNNTSSKTNSKSSRNNANNNKTSSSASAAAAASNENNEENNNDNYIQEDQANDDYEQQQQQQENENEQQQQEEGGENNDNNEDDEEEEEDPVYSEDQQSNFPLACLADMLLCPGASDAARKWRSPKTRRSGVQVLLSLWKMKIVPKDIVTERTISSSTAQSFDVGCAVLGKASRQPLPIRVSENNENEEEVQNDDDDDVSQIIPVDDRDPSYVARHGIVIPATDVRNIATTFRKNLKVFSSVSSIGYNGHHELELEERATLTTIQQFVSLCKDEVWETVSNSLLSAGVEPTSADWETLRILREGAEQRASSLQATRAAFSEMQRRQREVAEKTFYEALIKRTHDRDSVGGGDNATRRGLSSSASQQQEEEYSMQQQQQQGGSTDKMSSVRFEGQSGAGERGGVSNMSITETKMRNKQMLKSSFKYPTGSKQAKEQQQQLLQEQGNINDGAFGNMRHSSADFASDEDQQQQQQQQQQTFEGTLGSDASSSTENVDVEKGEDGAFHFRSVVERWGVGQRLMSEEEYNIFQAINNLRTNPRSFVSLFENALKRYDTERGAIMPAANSHDDELVMEEGISCIEEAVEFLKKVRPLSVLLDVPSGMLYASRDFIKVAEKRLDNVAQEEEGSSPEKRLARYGKLEGKHFQLMSLGCLTPESVVLQLVLGDGSPTVRPDRSALFDPEFRCCSVAAADHPAYKHIVQISLASSFSDNPHHQQKQTHEQMWSDI